MTETPMNCGSYVEEISLLAAGCLAAREESKLRDHLAICRDCRTRFEEMTALTSMLRDAKPVLDETRVCAIEYNVRRISSQSQLVGLPICSMNLRSAILAASIFLLVGLLGLISRRERESIPAESVSVVQVVIPPNVPTKQVDPPLPTLIALQRAAAESEESFDKLLAEYARTSFPEPVDIPTLWQRSLQ